MAAANTSIQEDGFGFVPRPGIKEYGRSYEIVRRYSFFLFSSSFVYFCVVNEKKKKNKKKNQTPFQRISHHPIRYTLTNKQRATVRLISWGAGIQSIKVPNKKGVLGDVVLGFDDMNGKIVSYSSD